MSETLTAVLVGCGAISDGWLKDIAGIEDLALVGLVDLDEEVAAKQALKHDLHDVVVGADLKEMLRQTAPVLVFDLTVPAAHADVTVMALEHGCHVLGEKPMADSMDNARRAVEAAERAGRCYAVMQNRRYDPNIRRLRRLIDTGALGPLTTVNSDFYIGLHVEGFRRHMRHVLLLDMAIHTFDAARLISGADPVSVYCKEWNPSGSWYDHDASAIAIFEMTGGIVYCYRGSWCGEGLITPWESRWRIIGQEGTATWDGVDGIEAQTPTEVIGYHATLADLAVPDPDPNDRGGGHAGQIRDFVDCVREGRTPETICTDNIKSLAMVFAAIESAETGQRVAVRW